jgi:hypothetical protein
MKELLSGLLGPVTGIINKVVPDKDEAARLAHETFKTVEWIPVRVYAFFGYIRHDLIFGGEASLRDIWLKALIVAYELQIHT